jgi:hypothetical protein
MSDFDFLMVLLAIRPSGTPYQSQSGILHRISACDRSFIDVLDFDHLDIGSDAVFAVEKNFDNHIISARDAPYKAMWGRDYRTRGGINPKPFRQSGV